MYDAVKHVGLDQVRTAVVGDTINKRVVQYVEANKPAETLAKRLLCNDDIPAPIASLVQMHTMHAISTHREVDVFRSTSMATNAKEDAAVAADAELVQNTLARTSSKSFSEEIYVRLNSRQARHHSYSCTRRNRNHKSS